MERNVTEDIKQTCPEDPDEEGDRYPDDEYEEGDERYFD